MGDLHITNSIPLCDDAHFSPFEQYSNMLKDERYQFEKIIKITK